MNPMISTELKSHFLRLYQMAFSDDNFDVLELQMLYKFAEERGITKDQLNEILLNPSHDSSIPESLEKRVEYLSATDEEALEAFQYCCKLEGIIPALEPAHALAVVKKIAPKMDKSKVIVMNMCGRGDKDIFTVAKALDVNV